MSNDDRMYHNLPMGLNREVVGFARDVSLVRNNIVRRIGLWSIVINFFNECRIGALTRRTDLIERVKEHGWENSIPTMDCYRNYLYKAGYLEYPLHPNGRKILGKYILKKAIPNNLSLADVRSEAYGNMEEIEIGIDSEGITQNITFTQEALQSISDHPHKKPRRTRRAAVEPFRFIEEKEFKV